MAKRGVTRSRVEGVRLHVIMLVFEPYGYQGDAESKSVSD